MAKRVVKPAAERQRESLDVAQRLFFEEGYEGTNVQQIIDELGLSKRVGSKTSPLRDGVRPRDSVSAGRVRASRKPHTPLTLAEPAYESAARRSVFQPL